MLAKLTLLVSMLGMDPSVPGTSEDEAPRFAADPPGCCFFLTYPVGYLCCGTCTRAFVDAATQGGGEEASAVVVPPAHRRAAMLY